MEFFSVKPGDPGQRQLLGVEDQGRIPSRGPVCDLAAWVKDGVWSVHWRLGAGTPPGPVRLEAHTVVCEDADEPTSCAPVSQATVMVEVSFAFN